MNRIAWLLVGLVGVLIVAMFYLFVFQPNREELAEVEERIALQEEQQQLLQAEIVRLESVRDTAPELEADLAAAETIVPRDPALPALLRQLQVAADESGITLLSIGTGRPVDLADETVRGLASINLSVQIEGGYFQVIDFLRRVEEPGITSRGVLWNNVTVSRNDDAYPALQFTLSGSSFAVLPQPVVEDPPPDPGTENDVDSGSEAPGDEPDGEVES
jgi:Tfp pilus assembly protein PilO